MTPLHGILNEEEKENLWNQVLNALDSNDEDRVISLSEKLSDAGDWRGSNTLGYVFEVKARRVSEEARRQGRENFIDRESFISAAHWYTRALSQGGRYAPHRGLATYYYYGLGGKYDFKVAYEHLKYCIEHVSTVTQSPALVQNFATAQIMMAELLFLGLGAPKDVNTARKLFSSAAEAGYPAALIGLSRIEKAEKRFIRSILYLFRAVRMAVKLIIENKDHPLLAGTGGKRHTFQRWWKEEEDATQWH